MLESGNFRINAQKKQRRCWGHPPKQRLRGSERRKLQGGPAIHHCVNDGVISNCSFSLSTPCCFLEPRRRIKNRPSCSVLLDIVPHCRLRWSSREVVSYDPVQFIRHLEFCDSRELSMVLLDFVLSATSSNSVSTQLALTAVCIATASWIRQRRAYFPQILYLVLYRCRCCMRRRSKPVYLRSVLLRLVVREKLLLLKCPLRKPSRKAFEYIIGYTAVTPFPICNLHTVA